MAAAYGRVTLACDLAKMLVQLSVAYAGHLNAIRSGLENLVNDVAVLDPSNWGLKSLEN